MSFGAKRGVFGAAFGGGGGGGEGASIALNLTALMDILSNLLFFLLASYTAQSVEVESRAGLKLPSSSSQLALTPQLTITVTASRIDVSGVPVANVDHGQVVGALDAEGRIGPLFERLRNVKLSRTAAGRADLVDADLVLLLADKGTDSKTITSVLKTAGHAGFYNVRFGVIAR
jgi:biopolymer transport protein ExbD